MGKTSLKELEDSIKADKEKGISRNIEIVDAPPQKFKINELYLRADNKAAYVYVIKED